MLPYDIPLILTTLRDIGGQLPHNDITLYQHLKETGELLEELTDNTDVILAGYFHSVYSTDMYKYNATVTRKEIQELIGVEAEQLVYTFCSLNPRTKTILEGSDSNLLWIELANTVVQASQRNISRINQAILKLEYLGFTVNRVPIIKSFREKESNRRPV